MVVVEVDVVVLGAAVVVEVVMTVGAGVSTAPGSALEHAAAAASTRARARGVRRRIGPLLSGGENRSRSHGSSSSESGAYLRERGDLAHPREGITVAGQRRIRTGLRSDHGAPTYGRGTTGTLAVATTLGPMTPRTKQLALVIAVAAAVAAFLKRPIAHPERQGSWHPADHTTARN